MNKYLVVVLMLCIGAFGQTNFEKWKTEAQSGDVAAMMKVAAAYESGKGVKADRFEAADWYMKAAAKGNAEAQNVTGVMLRTGDGGRKDPEEALKWFRLAAKQGYADAMFNLATAYYNGDGVAISDQQALAWFIVAQAFGNKLADEAVHRSLADMKSIAQAVGTMKAAQMLIDGTEVPARSQAAVAWLELLVKAGRKSANVTLAELYMEGKGVPKDQELAIRYCEEGAAAKVPQAMDCLGRIYKNGLGRPVDLHTAFTWYMKAAKCGDPVGTFFVSEMYGAGEGVKQDRVQQYALLEMAGHDLPKAREKAAELKSQLTEKELKAAQKKLLEHTSGCNFDAAMQ